MRILYITRAKLSLSRAHNQNILKTAETILKEGERSVRVVSCAAEQSTADEILRVKEIFSVFQLDIAERKRSALWYCLQNRRAYDLLYFRDPYLWHTAYIMRFVFGKKVVFEIHGSHEWKYQWFIWFLALGAAHGAVFITQALRDYYHTKKPFVIVPCYGVALEQFHVQEQIDVLRDRMLLPRDRVLVMYLGSLLWYSMEALIDMMRFLPQNMTLVIVGAKEEEQPVLRARASEQGVADRVLIRGRVPHHDVVSYLCAADILINPLVIMYPGSISAKLYEYLAAGKPIVSSPGGANAEVITHEKNGLLVPLTARDFADAVLRIQHDPPFARNLATNARSTARRFTWEARAKSICSLINKLMISLPL